MIYPSYITFISVDLVYHKILRAEVGKGGISTNVALVCCLS